VSPGGTIVLAPVAISLGALHGRPPAARLAHHAGGLCCALQDTGGVIGDGASQAQAVQRLLACRDILDGEIRLFRIGGQQRGGMGDGGAVAAGLVFGCLGGRRGQEGTEGVGDLVVDRLGEDVGRVRDGGLFHRRNI
jgi:hypothetical protein